MFGVEVKGREAVFCDPIEARGSLHRVLVDHSHGHHLGADTPVRINDEEETTFRLKQVITVTSIKHFAHLWKRHAKTLKKRRQLLASSLEARQDLMKASSLEA